MNGGSQIWKAFLVLSTIIVTIAACIAIYQFAPTVLSEISHASPSVDTSTNTSGSTNVGVTPPAATQTFQCPSTDEVSSWMGTSVSQISEYCAFHGGDVQGQTLSGVICTNQDEGTTIEYTPVNEPNTLVVASCDGSTLPEIYGFTIRFVEAYPSSGPYSASVCAIAQAAPQHLPSGWTVDPQANC